MMKPRLALLLFLGVTLTLVGCYTKYDVDNARRSGYESGFEDGRKVGFDDGVTAGIEQVAPGADPRMTGTFGSAKRVIVVVSSLKLILLLFLAIGYLVREGTAPRQRIAKLLCIFLGAIIVLWIADMIGYSTMVKRITLSPTPTSWWAGLLCSVGSAVFIYIILWAFHRYFILTQQETQVQAFCIFVLSAALTLLMPTLYEFVIDIPRTDRYLASDILMGTLIGGTLFIVRTLLSNPDPIGQQRRMSSKPGRSRGLSIPKLMGDEAEQSFASSTVEVQEDT